MLKVVGASWEKTRFTTFMLGTVTIVAIFAIFFLEFPIDHNDGNYAATVYWSRHGGFSLKFWGQGNNPEHIQHGVVRAYYRPRITSTGWATLEIQSQSKYPDSVQAHAAGLVEGSLSWQLIFWHWQNTVAYPCEARQDFCYRTRNYLREASEKMRHMANQSANTDPLWHQVGLFFAQLDGIERGWKYGVTRSRKNKEIDIPSIDFLLMNAVCDIRDLEFKYNVTREADFKKSPLSISLLKILADSKETFLLAHASSGFYTDMLRLQKKYTFGYHMTGDNRSELVPGQSIEFTSYPAAIHSQDDFYHVNGTQKLIVSGTSIRNYNGSLWSKTNTSKLLLGPRVMAANRLAANGSEWGNILSTGNGGTGIKQWLVLRSNQKSVNMWLIEQIPGKTVIEDQSQTLLDKGYWASYGLPYNKEILDEIGYKEAAAADIEINDFFNKVNSLLADGQKNVTDQQTLQELMWSPEMALVGRSDIRGYFLTSSSLEDSFNASNKLENEIQMNGTTKESSTLRSDLNSTRDVKEIGFTDEPEPKNNTSQHRTGLSFLEKLKLFIKLEINKSSDNFSNDENTKEKDAEVSKTEVLQNFGVLRRELNGNIDLKITSGEGNFKAAAGPPYTEINGVYEVDPFRWSTSLFKGLPHHGQADTWNFDPVEPKWFW